MGKLDFKKRDIRGAKPLLSLDNLETGILPDKRPFRKCVVCGKSSQKSGLLRMVLRKGKEKSDLVFDFLQSESGRGWYVHPEYSCLGSKVFSECLYRAVLRVLGLKVRKVDGQTLVGEEIFDRSLIWDRTFAEKQFPGFVKEVALKNITSRKLLLRDVYQKAYEILSTGVLSSGLPSDFDSSHEGINSGKGNTRKGGGNRKGSGRTRGIRL
ncbi:MAG TPA: DUF448 domain-containing protein [Oligoflexia bacterium]|nr:DUF448 domain-containing protein [Oligoflexia bacterium]HMP49090.1 DUF448 domain-containing protein [Oligoflexia bacterium]